MSDECKDCKVNEYCKEKESVIACFGKADYEKFYEQGRADAIEKFADYIAQNCDCCKGIRIKCNNGMSCLIYDYAEQLKEQKNNLEE